MLAPVTLPSARVSPSMWTWVEDPLTSKIRVEWLPLTVIRAAPGPSMVMSWVMLSSLPRAIVPCSPFLKRITSESGEASARPTAQRSEPVEPSSSRLVTVIVDGTVRSSRAVSRGTKRAAVGRAIGPGGTGSRTAWGTSGGERERTAHLEREHAGMPS